MMSLPLADILELVGVIDHNVDTKVHADLLEVDVQASNLCVGDLCLHGLTGNSAVEGISLDEHRLGGRLSVSLQDVDGLDGVLALATAVGRLDSEHGIDSHVGEELIVTIVGIYQK